VRRLDISHLLPFRQLIKRSNLFIIKIIVDYNTVIPHLTTLPMTILQWLFIFLKDEKKLFSQFDDAQGSRYQYSTE